MPIHFTLEFLEKQAAQAILFTMKRWVGKVNARLFGFPRGGKISSYFTEKNRRIKKL
jgi:hypothetical protein